MGRSYEHPCIRRGWGEKVSKILWFGEYFLGSVAEFVGKKGEKRPRDFDRRAARAKAEKPPLCSFSFAGERLGFSMALKRQEVVGHC